MLQNLIVFAAEEAHEKSHTAFYIAGGLLTLWAIVVSAIGIRRNEDWPSSDGTARGIMGISAVLVIAAMATAVAVS